jgi:RNA-binding protein 23/39
MGLSGQKLLGIPIVVQHTQAEKNRQGNSMISMMSRGAAGPMRLYVGSLHFNITEDMLRGIFEPFGKIESIQLQMDPETGRSRGYGFVTVSYFSNYLPWLHFISQLFYSIAILKMPNVLWTS